MGSSGCIPRKNKINPDVSNPIFLHKSELASLIEEDLNF